MDDLADYRFEPEFDGDPPRPIPPELLDSPFSRRRRNAVLGVASAGAFCLLVSFMPVMQRWGLFCLPLAYLEWIGYGLLALAAGLGLRDRLALGPYRYVVEGTPLAGRVVEVANVPAGGPNQPGAHRPVAVVEFTHPETGEPSVIRVGADPLTGADLKKWELSCRPGDAVTLVYLPGRLEESLRLYGLLGLRHGEGLVRLDAPAEPTGSLWQTAATLVGAAGFFLLLILAFYGVTQYWPLETTSGVLIAAGCGAAVSGALGVAVLVAQSRRQDKPAAPPQGSRLGRAFAAFWLGAGVLFMGAIVTAGSALCLNAWLDDSEATRRPVLITEMTQTTHNFVIRTYSMDYKFLDDPGGEEHNVSSTPDEMARFGRVPAPGMAVVREGFFGWAWLERIEPLPVVLPLAE